ncbi:MAG TPA: carbamoyltransferase HypF [Thermoanaerobaculia bacterium]|nr:carbamoyltransferase HypF [Thermoanaerobaculia bacterium]
MRKRLRVEIEGAVQGVGFRPFVYRLAADEGLGGWVLNDGRGVFLEVEGDPAAVERFRSRLSAERPPRARVTSVREREVPAAGEASFEIRFSRGEGEKSVQVLPDLATCVPCLADVRATSGRRRGYPFTNCTSCGPRFTIVRALPYDRPNTTMSGFALCAACRAEYESPRDRRFHAQPNACGACGPHLELWSAAGEVLAARDEALRSACRAIAGGRIAAVKGLGGFHLICDARSPGAVALLRERKARYEKPLALMVADLDAARALCEVTSEEALLLESPERPIVLLPSRPGNGIARNVAPGNPNLGLMLPATPLHHLMLDELGFPLVATSGNLSDEPICTDEREALGRLGGMADLFLVHDRPVERHVDDSVARVVDGVPRLLRRARGWAPLPVRLPFETPPLLAVGAHLKNVVALAVGRQAFLSQHVGDLETPQALAAFERVLGDLARLYEVKPAAVAHDLHPDYLSTRWALASGLPAVAVQHHHAHLASCLAENGVDGPALGVTWDGTGFGTDGTVWGGEFLLGDANGFERVAHLRPFSLPGGEAAVREPRRSAAGLLWEMALEGGSRREGGRGEPTGGFFEGKNDDVGETAGAFTGAEKRVLSTMLERAVNSPVTTSAGRLFDAVASLLGVAQKCSFEGQAAMRLEWLADPNETDTGSLYLPLEESGALPSFDVMTGFEVPAGASATRRRLVLDWSPLVSGLLAERAADVPIERLSARFHNALAAAIAAVARRVGCPRVALTGGCFQNRLLTERAAAALRREGFEVLLHREVPPNDGGICLGQAAVAAARLAAGRGNLG